MNHLQLPVSELPEMARQLRRDVIKMLLISKSGHSGGPLGSADIFSSLYFNILNIDPKNPSWNDRDYFFLSAGHYCPIWYAALARAGYFQLSELTTLRKINGHLQGHPAPASTHGVAGVELASGSLGQGLSVAVGCALGLRLNKSSRRVYAFLGDGELDEGQIWESAMTAAHHKVDNLIAIVDRNNCQIDGTTDTVLNLNPLTDKWRAFNWNVAECDGNNIEDFLKTMKQVQSFKGKPSVIIAHTKMGKSVSFMEDDYRWHGVPPSDEQGKKALSEIAPTKHGDFIEFEWEK
ncbi:MAG: transketolase [Ignavibacteriales bacterium]|nr:transketolase [Ignavibacteriales bacterium]